MGVNNDNSCDTCNAFAPLHHEEQPWEKGYTEYCEYCTGHGMEQCSLHGGYCPVHCRKLNFNGPAVDLVRQILNITKKKADIERERQEKEHVKLYGRPPYRSAYDPPVPDEVPLTTDKRSGASRLTMCVPCWRLVDGFPGAGFRYCPACDEMVVVGPGKTCPACSTRTLVDVPDTWEEFKLVLPTLKRRQLLVWLELGKDNLDKDLVAKVINVIAGAGGNRVILPDDTAFLVNGWDGTFNLSMKVILKDQLVHPIWGRSYTQEYKGVIRLFPVNSTSRERMQAGQFIIFHDREDCFYELWHEYDFVKGVLDPIGAAILEATGFKLAYGVLDATSGTVERVPDDPEQAGGVIVSPQELQRRAASKLPDD